MKRKTAPQAQTALVPTTQSYLDRLQASAPPNEVPIATAMQIGDESKYVNVGINHRAAPYRDSIEIIHITDVQYGHKACNVEKFIEYRDWVLAERNRFVFFGGDMIDAATQISVGSPYENTEDPQTQVHRFCELAMPMRHRVLGYVGGNHERRTSKTYGDAGHTIATLLKIPYSSGKQYVDIYYGQHKPFKNSLWHGGSGSKTDGAKMNMLSYFARQGDSHLYWVGHLHDCLCKYWVRERRSPEGDKITLEKYAGVMSSSFLEHWGTYAEVAGLPAGDTNMWKLILWPNGKWELVIR